MYLKMASIIGSSIGLFFLSCSMHANDDYTHSERIVVSGKVLNFPIGNSTIRFAVNRIAFRQESICANLDSAGNFKINFESYIPTDIWVVYKETNFAIVVHPKDSLHVVFDGRPSDRPDILKTIAFSGTSAKLNTDVAKFQYLYFSNELYTNWDNNSKVVKEYNENRYLSYLDTVRQKGRQLRNDYVVTCHPRQEAILWVNNFLEGNCYYNLAYYPMKHRNANRLSESEWKVSTSYYDHFLKRLPIDPSMYICGSGLSSLVNSFHFGYANKHALQENRDSIIHSSTASDPSDSLMCFKLLKYVPDPLLKQMILTEDLNWELGRMNVKIIEMHRAKIESIIRQPFLIEPLMKEYHEAKMKLENPQIASNTMLKLRNNSTTKQIMDSILILNRGKVIYMDCWATWCGPCLAEMPNSKRLMKELADENVAFVYVCLDSNEPKWKAILSGLQLGGQHYLLTPTQSADFRSAFAISGIPHYFLFDRQGTVLENGSTLRPDHVKDKILALLRPKI